MMDDMHKLLSRRGFLLGYGNRRRHRDPCRLWWRQRDERPRCHHCRHETRRTNRRRTSRRDRTRLDARDRRKHERHRRARRRCDDRLRPTVTPAMAAAAPKPEKGKITIAVGGQDQFIYLPVTLANQLGYFKMLGLDVEIANFSGGAKAAEALVGGSADMVCGFYDHTIRCSRRARP